MQLVTIVTITFNSSKFVHQAIESVLAQSYTNFEYIISDDASSDNTWDIIQQYNDPRVKAFKNEKNIGEYPNRNKTLNLASGKYIIWIDGDDILYPHGLEFMVKMLDAFPNSAMACARPYWKNMVYPYELSSLEALKYEFLGSPVLVNGFPDTLFKTDILKDLGGFPENIISGDTYSKRKIACKYPVLLVSQHVSWWRRTTGQASNKLKSLNGLLNTFKNDLKIINSEDCILDKSDKSLAIEIKKTELAKLLILRYLLKGEILKTFKTKKEYNILYKHFFNSIFKRRRFYINGSAESPLILKFDRNPYSKAYENS